MLSLEFCATHKIIFLVLLSASEPDHTQIRPMDGSVVCAE